MMHRCRRVSVAVLIVATTVAACGGASDDGASPGDSAAADHTADRPADPTAAPDTPQDRAAVLVAAEVESFDPADLDAQLARGAELDRQADLELAAWSGLEEALGGREATAAAFATHDAFLEGIAAVIATPPVLGIRRTQVDGPNIGMGMFGGFMVVGMGSEGLVTATNDGTVGTTKPGELPTGMQITATKDSVEMTVDVVHEADGMTTDLKTKIKMTPCPDANGDFVAEAKIDVSAKAGAKGQTGVLDVKVTGHVDDDANLAGSDTQIHMKRTGLGMGSFVDVTIGLNADGSASQTFNDFNWFTTSDEDFTSTAQLAGLYGAMVRQFVLDAAAKGYQSGRCVDVGYTVSPGVSGLEPDSAANIVARPVSKMDGAPTGGTVTATLTAGTQSVEPSGTKVPVDAEFVFTAPSERNKEGTVALEARSRRGVGKTSITLDTKSANAYQIVGGLDDWQTDTAVCDIMAPFTLTGILQMQLSGGLSGSYEYSGGPFGAAGSGTYTISLPEGPGKPGTMTGSGSGSVDTPMGRASNTGTEQYTLTPLENCS